MDSKLLTHRESFRVAHGNVVVGQLADGFWFHVSGMLSCACTRAVYE